MDGRGAWGADCLLDCYLLVEMDTLYAVSYPVITRKERLVSLNGIFLSWRGDWIRVLRGSLLGSSRTRGVCRAGKHLGCVWDTVVQ